MALRPVLDLDLLRTLLFIAEEGSFTRAAELVGRTQSAVTLQMQKLEAQIGHPLLLRSKGGPVELTPQGRSMADVARRMLQLNDEAFRELAELNPRTTLRLGASEYYRPFFLDRALAAIREEFPNVLVEVIGGKSCQLFPQIKDGVFDIVVGESNHEPRGWDSMLVWKGPLRWVTSETQDTHRRNPLPLSLYPSDCPWRPAWMQDCYWRTATIAALRQVGRPYEIACVAETQSEHFAAVLAGDAVTVSIGTAVPPGLRLVGQDEGLPPLPDLGVSVVRAAKPSQPAADRLVDLIVSDFAVP